MKQHFTPEAEKLWQAIPPDKQELLLALGWLCLQMIKGLVHQK